MKILILAFLVGMLCLAIGAHHGNVCGTLLLVAGALVVAGLDLGTIATRPTYRALTIGRTIHRIG